MSLFGKYEGRGGKAQTRRLLDRNLTPKQRVLKRWPNASATSYAGPAWVIYNNEYANQALNVSSPSPKSAWADAAKHPSVRRVGGRTDG